MKGVSFMLNTVKRTKTARRIISACFLFVFLLSACASVQQDVLPEEASQPETERDPYEPLYVSSSILRDEYGNMVPKIYREECFFTPLKYGGMERDTSKTPVISDNWVSMGGPSLEQYTALAELIVVGTVVGEGEEALSELPYHMLPFKGMTYHYIVPEKILWQMDGERELGEKIDVYQKEDEIQMETGDKVICFLNDRAEHGWVAVCLEHALFKVTEEGKMCSFSDFRDLSQYDSLTQEEFEELVICFIKAYHYAIPYSEYIQSKEG